MYTGALHLRECIYCKHRLIELVPGEDNTAGAKFYSDGKMKGLHTPASGLIKCGCCQEYIWLQATPILQQSNYYYWQEKSWMKLSVPKNLQYAQVPEELGIDELFQVLKAKFVSKPSDEIYIRQQLCWRFNDRIRRGSPIFVRSHELSMWMENTMAFLDLLDPQQPLELVMMAELMRYVGDFGRSAEIISCLDDPDYQWSVPLYLRKCRNRDTEVFLLGENVNKEFVMKA